MRISVVTPVYRAEKIVDELVLQLHLELMKITEDYEIILVNDASPDKSWEKIEEVCKQDKRVKGIDLSRNFGQHYAITAGLHYAKGEWVVVMDCDLQDRPDQIVKLYNKALEGYDIVYARRIERQDNVLKRLSSKIFHSVYSYLSGIKTDSTIANFGVYSYRVIREYNNMKERARSFWGLLRYLGFETTAVDVQHSSRFEGKSSYSLTKLLSLAFDVLISNNNKPLRLSVQFGFVVTFFSFLLAAYNIIAYFVGMIKVEGFTTIIFSIWFTTGLLMIVIGMVGLYVGKIFDEVKERQLFIVKNKNNIDE